MMAFAGGEETLPQPPVWQTIYVSVVLLAMFIVLFSDRYGSDAVMMGTLTAMLAPGIISMQEALVGFSNSGLWTIMILFVVAEAIAKTGAFGWYMTKFLGAPKTIASAQLRLMLPITTVSAFLNNTPIVVIMIPIVQQWAGNTGLDVRQLLIPLSWATILGGTITVIGTSTNLVIVGMFEKHYPTSDNISLFDLSAYGLPYALVGLSYILLVSPLILGRSGKQVASTNEPILLGARVTRWSPAAGRSVKRSGLRDTGGIYLVSVARAQTGHVHRAVSGEFILNVGDILYFTGLVESFGTFCSEHGLEVVTNESNPFNNSIVERILENEAVAENTMVKVASPTSARSETSSPRNKENAIPIGITKESLVRASHSERMRCISVMTDLIRGYKPPSEEEMMSLTTETQHPARGNDPPQIVAATDSDVICVGINCPDRPGLLLDISKGLLQLNLQLHNTEAAVVSERSISIWRCQYMQTESLKATDLNEIWSVLSSLLSPNSVQVIKQRGSQVIRACVTKGSRLINKTVAEVEVRAWYRAAIVAVQQEKGSNEGNELATSTDLSSVRFREGDVLILQASNDSPLLRKPPVDPIMPTPRSLAANVVNTLLGRNNSLDGPEFSRGGKDVLVDIETGNADIRAAWNDLRVLSHPSSLDAEQPITAAPEFLTAMKVSEEAGWIGKTAKQVRIHNLPNLVLVSIERQGCTIDSVPSEIRASFKAGVKTLQALSPDTPLEAGDILWFSGPASAIGDLRKIPGLVSYEHEEVKKMKEKEYERRLVQAVVSRKGPLVGKTVKEVRFRTHFGAAVISVQREGKRVHELPGTIKLQAGDVLLLEAGPSFLAKNHQNDISFALLSEVKNSAPPRLRLLIPTLIIVSAALAVYIAELTSLLVTMLVAAIMLICLGVLSEQEARQSLNWSIFLTIGAAFGIGQALVNSGVADVIADFLVRVGERLGLGDAGVIAGVYFTTFIIGNVLTNTATAAIVFPIAMNAANQMGTSPTLMCFNLMLAASASFMSPYGYTTNLLIYGPGSYKYSDFLYFGTPLQFVLWFYATVILSVDSYYTTWILSVALFILVTFVRVFYAAPLPSFANDGEAQLLHSGNKKGDFETPVVTEGTYLLADSMSQHNPLGN